MQMVGGVVRILLQSSVKNRGIAMGTELTGGVLGAFMTSPIVTAAAVAALTIFSLLFGRFEIRLRRLRLIRDYIKTFPNTAHSFENAGINPSFEFVRSKYSADINLDLNRRDGMTEVDEQIAQIDATINATRAFGNTGDIRLLLDSLAYAVVIFAGFQLLFTNILCNAGQSPCGSSAWLSVFVLGGNAGTTSFAENPGLLWSAQNIATIASFAFVGAFASSIRYLVRALSVFDLQAFTFIRQAAVTTITVLVTIALYRAVPDPMSLIDSIRSGEPAILPAINPGVSFTWMLLALGFGLLPESAARFALLRISPWTKWLKSTDDRFLTWTRIVPLDVIDGIDFFTRFRLEECGINEVQALATYNPIMLHIETPYGIYQAIDWIAQAQLCCVVGLDRFLLLRQFNIRTIFDLERAIIQDSPIRREDSAVIDKFDAFYAGILFAPNMALTGIQKESHAKFLITQDNVTKEVDAAEFANWGRSMFIDPKSATQAIEHVMMWIGDDLHVRRLRRLWNEISVRLGPDSVSLFTNERIELQSKALQAVLASSSKVR